LFLLIKLIKHNKILSEKTQKKFFLRLFNIIDATVTKESLKIQLEKYHFSPLVSDISKMLSTWNIKNMVVENVPLENLNEAPLPIISITKSNELFLIREVISEQYNCFFQKTLEEKLISKNDFLSTTKGIYILMETNEYSGEINFNEKEYKNKTTRISSFIIVLNFFIITSLGFFIIKTQNLLFYSLSVFGFTTSIYLLLKEYYFFSNSNFDICKIGKSFDCNSIIRSKESKIFIFSLAEISTGFFVFLMLCCIYSDITHTNLSFIAPLIYTSIIGIVYSLIQQIRMKSYCILCLAISLILMSLVLTINTFYNFKVEFQNNVLNIFFSFSLSLLILSLLKGYLLFHRDSKISDARLFSLLNSSVLSNSLKQDRIDCIYFKNEIFIGSRDREFEMILFMNPLCSKCKTILKNLPRLFSEFENQIYLRILYSGPEDDSAKAKHMFANLLKKLEQNSDEEKIASIAKYISNLKINKVFDRTILDSLTNQYSWSNKLGLEGTPAIILNGIKLPSFFGVEAVSTLIRNIKDT